MFHFSRTTLRELKKRYLNILKKCILVNLVMFMVSLPAMGDDISKTYENTSIDTVFGYSSETEGLMGKPNIDVVVKNTLVNDGAGSMGSVVGFELTNNVTDYLTADIGDINVTVQGDQTNRVEKYIWGVNLLGLKNTGGEFNFKDVTINAMGKSTENPLISQKIFGMNMQGTPGNAQTGYYSSLESLTLNVNHLKVDHSSSPVIFGVYQTPAGAKLLEYSILEIKNNLVLNLNDIEAELIQLKDGGGTFFANDMILNLSNSTIKKLTTSSTYSMITGLKALEKNQHIGNLILNISDSFIDTHILGVWNPGNLSKIEEVEWGDLDNVIISLSGETLVSGSVLSSGRTHYSNFNPMDLKVTGKKQLFLKNGNIKIEAKIDNLKINGATPGISGFDVIEAENVTLTTPLMQLGEKTVVNNSIFNVDKIEKAAVTENQARLAEKNILSVTDSNLNVDEILLPETDIELVNSRVVSQKLTAGENLSIMGGDFKAVDVDLSLTKNLTVNQTTFNPDSLILPTALNLSSNGGLIDFSNLNGGVSLGAVEGVNGALIVLPQDEKLEMKSVANKEGGLGVLINSKEAKVKVGTIQNEGFKLQTTSELSNSLKTDEEAKALAAILEIENKEKSKGFQVNVAEGALLGEEAFLFDGNGRFLSSIKKMNTVTKSLEDVTHQSYLSFRSGMNDVQKRMGDLRIMPEKSGAWVRFINGKTKYSSAVKNYYHTLQGGVDARLGDFYFGTALTYTDSNGKVQNGTNEGDAVGVSLYGGWLGKNGAYVDVIMKHTRQDMKFDLYNLDGQISRGDFDTHGNSISIETGKRFQNEKGFYIEPQAEVMIGRVNGASFTTSRDVDVQQKGFSSLITRAGLGIGYLSPDETKSIYLKASVLNDFMGKTKASYTYRGRTLEYKDDLGGAWTEFALGGTYNLSDKISFYGEAETNIGAPVQTKYQFSVGARFSF